MPAALALNALNPSTASAQNSEKAASSAFDPLRVSKKGQFAGVYTGFATSVTERNDDANHSSIPLDIPDKKEKACPNDGDVCADISKYAKTYVADFTDFVDAIKAAKKGSEEAIFRGTPFPIPPKEKEENKDTLFSDDLRCYLEIYQAMDAIDGTADGIVHGVALTKVLAKASPERSKLAQKCNVDYFGRENTELSREIYFSTAAPLFAGLTKIAYEGPNSMVEGYVPQKILDETQGKLDAANDELGKNKKALEKANQDIGDLQNSRDAAEAKARRYEEIFKYSLIGAGSLLALGLMIMIGLRVRKARSQTSPAPKAELKPNTETKLKTETKPEAPEPKPEPEKAKEPEQNEMDEIEKELAAIAGNQTPVENSTSNGVSSANVIIAGVNAKPEPGVDAKVIAAQLLAHYPTFQTAAFADYLNAPSGSKPPAINVVKPGFDNELGNLVDRVMVEYYDSKDIDTLWEEQKKKRDYIVRRGVPEKLLIKTVQEYLQETAKLTTPPISLEVRDELMAQTPLELSTLTHRMKRLMFMVEAEKGS
jgi:hypothetical protein